MDPFQLFAALTTLAALFSWLNHRYLRLPTTIALMVLSLGFSLGLVGLGQRRVGIQDELARSRARLYREVPGA